MFCLFGLYGKDAVSSLLGNPAMETDGYIIGWYINELYLQPSSRREHSRTVIEDGILDYPRF